MINFKLACLEAVILLVAVILGKGYGQMCDKLSKKPWLPYDVSSVSKVPGIYVIGEKRGSETKYIYAGRSNDVKRRLQEHKSQKQQHIDKRVADKFKKHKGTDLRIKYVPEQRQKSKEGKYMQCLTNKIGYRPVMNKREGDGCASCARGQKRKSDSKISDKHSSSRSPAAPKVTKPSSRRSGGSKTSSGPSLKSSGRPKVSTGPSFRSPGTPKMSSGRSSFRSSASSKVSSGKSSFRSSGRSSFRSSSRRK